MKKEAGPKSPAVARSKASSAAQRKSDATGYWHTDPPELEDLLKPHGLDATNFGTWLGPKLSHYRGMAAAQVAAPTAGEELKALQHLLVNVTAAAPVLRPGALPGLTDEALYLQAIKAGVDWFELRGRVAQDLLILQVILSRAVSAREAAPAAKVGPKSRASRDRLLTDIVGWLRNSGVKAEVARRMTDEILVRCRVNVPGADGIKKAVRRFGGKNSLG